MTLLSINAVPAVARTAEREARDVYGDEANYVLTFCGIEIARVYTREAIDAILEDPTWPDGSSLINFQKLY